MIAHLREEGKASQWLNVLLRVPDITNSWLLLFDVIEQLALLVFSILVVTIVTTRWFEYPFGGSTIYAILAGLLMGPICWTFICITGRARKTCALLDRCDRMLDGLVEQLQ